MMAALAPNAFSVEEQTRAMEDAPAAARGTFDRVFGANPKGSSGVRASVSRPKRCATICWPSIC